MRRVLFVGRGRVSLPLAPWLAKKWDALGEVFDWRVLNAGTGSGDDRFHLLPDGAVRFYLRLPVEVARELRSFRPEVIVAADPYVAACALAGRRIARSRSRVIVEVHGDPRTFTRLYGSPARRALSPVGDLLSRASLRNADSTRALSRFTSSLVEEVRGVPATACFPTYSDLSAFADPPIRAVPEAQTLLFVGALEPYKNVRGLVAAWRRLAAQLPNSRLTIVGDGSQRAVVDDLVRDLPNQVEYWPELVPTDVAHALDGTRALVLPSYPEGLGRVVLEAFARGRTVVATDAGGIPDIVTNADDGLLVPAGDGDALVAAMRSVLVDRALAERLGESARKTYAAWHQTPEDFARAYRELIDRTLAGAR